MRQNGCNRLYRRKQNEPDFRLWQKGATSLMIDFGYTQAETGPRIPVDIDPLYQGQGHGWVTDTKRQLFPCAQRQDQTGLHGIWSNQDGAFRVDLPNADTLLPQLTVPRNNPAKLT